MNIIKHKSGKSELQRRVCGKCGIIYYPTLIALKRHIPQCHGNISYYEDAHEIDDDEDNELYEGETFINEEQNILQ